MARQAGRRLPRAVRLVLVSGLMGAGIGALVTVASLTVGNSGLGHLLATSNEPWVPALLLFGGMMSTFAGLSAGTAIMLTVERRPHDRR